MILYINCCARRDSRTDRLARALLEKLGDYEELRLYEEPLRPLEDEDLARRDELLARFVRGDRSRHTEGSGLGLSIAQSLTELQGGAFRIEIDGDLFKAVVTFPQGGESA